MEESAEEIVIPLKKARAAAKKVDLTESDRDNLMRLRELKRRAVIEKTDFITDIAEKDYDKICRGLGKYIIDELDERKKNKKKAIKPVELVQSSSDGESEEEKPKKPQKKPLRRMPKIEPESEEEPEPIKTVKPKPLYNTKRIVEKEEPPAEAPQIPTRYGRR